MNSSGLRVFISYATPDEAAAIRLAEGLAAHGIDVFVAVRDTAPGQNFVRVIEDRLSVADYCVLLYSRHAVEREWVDLEWTAALAQELSDRRVFLFVVRLDDVELPLLLSVRRFIDGRSDLGSAVQALVRAWRLDVRHERDALPTRPAPDVDTTAIDDGTAGVYVVNRQLGVQHFMRVPRRLSGRQLHARLHSSLRLPAHHPVIEGGALVTYEYQVSYEDRPIRSDSDERFELLDEATLDLTIVVHLPNVRPNAAPLDVLYREGDEHLAAFDDAEMADMLRTHDAFAHLLP